jgi:hypothetical protein
MSLELSIKQLTLSIDILISILEKYNEVDPVIKMASEIIMEPEPTPTPTVKPVKQKPIPVFIPAPDETVTNIVEQPAVALGVLEMRDAIRTMCSEMVQNNKENKTGIEAIFAKYKATHLKMVDDAHIPSLYDSLTVFKGKLK